MTGICHRVLEAAGNRLANFQRYVTANATRENRVTMRSTCLMAGIVTKKISRFVGVEWNADELRKWCRRTEVRGRPGARKARGGGADGKVGFVRTREEQLHWTGLIRSRTARVVDWRTLE